MKQRVSVALMSVALMGVCALVLLAPPACNAAGQGGKDPGAAPVAGQEQLESLTLDQLNTLLANSKGKVVMLNFFATWCPPCRVEIPELVKVRDAYPASSLVVVGLAVDENSAPVLPFIRKAGVDYPVYLAGRDVTDAYHVTSVPHNAFFARDGSMVISEPGMADANVIRQVVDDLLSRK